VTACRPGCRQFRQLASPAEARTRDRRIMRATGCAGREGHSPAAPLGWWLVGSRAGVAVRDRQRTGRGLPAGRHPVRGHALTAAGPFDAGHGSRPPAPNRRVRLASALTRGRRR
jgi:hypothetical protein